MAYRIIYCTEQRKTWDSWKILRFQGYTVFFLLVTVVTVNAFWGEGAKQLHNILLAGSTQLETATAEFAKSWMAGDSLYRAAAEFCGEIIRGVA